MKLKRGTILIVFLAFLISIANVQVVSAMDSDSPIHSETHSFTNPMYTDVPKYSLFNNLQFSTLTYVPKFATVSDASVYMRKQMVKRTGAISFTVNRSYYSNIHSDIFNKAVAESASTNSSEGDYLYAHFRGYTCSISYTSSYVTITYQMSYLSTYTQELQVDAKVKKVLDTLNVYDCDEYTKIKAVHDYIVKNIKYDYTYKKHSAYNAIIENSVVCQGFSSLTYKMLKQLGIKVRYIIGNNSTHGWNIASINGKFYNIDNTWDENLSILPSISYNYFLKSNVDFIGHTRDSKYNSYAFNTSYPMSATSFVYKPIKVTSMTLNKTKATLAKGYTTKLTASILPTNATNKGVSWKSSNTAVAKVDAYGKVTAVGAGSATITGKAKDGSGKYATCKVTVTN